MQVYSVLVLVCFFAALHNRMLNGFYVRREKGFKICEINTYAVKFTWHEISDIKDDFGNCDGLIQSESGAVMREKIAYVRATRVQLPTRHERPRGAQRCQMC